MVQQQCHRKGTILSCSNLLFRLTTFNSLVFAPHVATNIEQLYEVRKIRQEIESKNTPAEDEQSNSAHKLSKDGCAHVQINNYQHASQVMNSITAMFLAHEGYHAANESALCMLSQAVERYVEKIGKSLNMYISVNQSRNLQHVLPEALSHVLQQMGIHSMDSLKQSCASYTVDASKALQLTKAALIKRMQDTSRDNTLNNSAHATPMQVDALDDVELDEETKKDFTEVATGVPLEEYVQPSTTIPEQDEDAVIQKSTHANLDDLELHSSTEIIRPVKRQLQQQPVVVAKRTIQQVVDAPKAVLQQDEKKTTDVEPTAMPAATTEVAAPNVPTNDNEGTNTNKRKREQDASDSEDDERPSKKQKYVQCVV